MKAVVIEIRKCQKFGKVGRVVAECVSLFMADALATGIERMQCRGEFRRDVGYMYCTIEQLHKVPEIYGFVLAD